MNQSDAMNNVDSRPFDPAKVPTDDEGVRISGALKAFHTSEADVEAVASRATSSLTLALARYIDDLGLDLGIDLMAEAQRFERGVIERALELTKGSQKRAAKLLGLNSSTLNTKIKKYGLKANRRNLSGR